MLLTSRIGGRGVREPGLPAIVPGLERYRVKGGGAVVVALAPGDEIAITDREGRQACEIGVFSPDGREDAGALGLVAKGKAEGISRLLRGEGERAEAIAAALRRRGVAGNVEKAAILFEHDSRPGETVRLKAERAAICIIHAAGGPMAADAQDPPTELGVAIQRAAVASDWRPPLPDPLADIKNEARIPPGTAFAYEVKAGEYIQIIDVEGRQCSDFVAFDARKLQAGIERGLDQTTTRTLMAAAYPAPGLYSKFLDRDMQPLVEVVRDTVGRHDSFALACTAKYYDDLGYPGHVNCSENFNKAVAPYGVEQRKGWPAINFFYNTGINAQNVLYLDEPWSRPGDYVLVRALTDLVCASSSCPDDIDAANAWNPTDIHVRVYPARNSFSKAMAFRMAPDAEPELTRETAFHKRTSALTRAFTEYRGFWLPQRYNNHGAVDEYYACRERAVVTDLSPLRKFEVVGPDSETLLQRACTRNIRRLAVGQVVYTAMCYEHGGMVDDATVFRLGKDNFRLIGGDEHDGRWLRELAEKDGLKVWVKSSTDQLHNIAVQGPRSRDILKEVLWTAPASPTLAELAWFHFAVARLGDFNGAPLVVSRTGYTGELGYELFCHPKDALAVWDAVMAAGKPHGIVPMGLEALDMLRIEAGLIFFGTEFTDKTDPFEAGIGFTVALKGNEEFIGREALIRRKEHPRETLVGLELEGAEAAAHGNCVHVGRAQVGVVTSAMRSPILKKNVALARLDVAHAAIGTAVEVGKIDGHQKRIAAKVARFPFYDPEKARVRG